jgi:lysyl-tRNA synthetase class 2
MPQSACSKKMCGCSKAQPRLTVLRDRAVMLAKVREFFRSRQVLEVDTPILSASASVDAHIDLIPVCYAGQQTRYMHSSPEFCMKRLLSEGIGDIYQLSHVFRDGELSRKHNPEFTMIEWYRLGFSLDELIQETVELIRLFIGEMPVRYITYRQAFQEYCGIDYVHATPNQLRDYLAARGLETTETDKNNLLDMVLTTYIEPQLGQNELTVLKHYPATMAALAKTIEKGDELAAERFEIYFRSIELCNGYHELTNPDEQLLRFREQNVLRKAIGKNELPIDDNFLNALRSGLPDCSGVAVGFDRLMMLRHSTNKIEEILPFSWETA